MDVSNTELTVIKDAVNFLTSEAIFIILSQLTGLNLHPLANSQDHPSSPEEEGSTSKNDGRWQVK